MGEHRAPAARVVPEPLPVDQLPEEMGSAALVSVPTSALNRRQSRWQQAVQKRAQGTNQGADSTVEKKEFACIPLHRRF